MNKYLDNTGTVLKQLVHYFQICMAMRFINLRIPLSLNNIFNSIALPSTLIIDSIDC
jgi:hypothetical protein